MMSAGSTKFSVGVLWTVSIFLYFAYVFEKVPFSVAVAGLVAILVWTVAVGVFVLSNIQRELEGSV